MEKIGESVLYFSIFLSFINNPHHIEDVQSYNRLLQHCLKMSGWKVQIQITKENIVYIIGFLPSGKTDEEIDY